MRHAASEQLTKPLQWLGHGIAEKPCLWQLVGEFNTNTSSHVAGSALMS